MYISGSVGKGGKNHASEVKFAQDILNLVAEEDMRMNPLTVDGQCGKATIDAIGKFQKFYVKLQPPDSRIDPNGRSEKVLVAKALEIDKGYLSELVKKYQLKKSNEGVLNKGPKILNYRTHAAKVVSSYTENIIKLAMSYAGIRSCDISSTIRTFDDQARIMYNNCASFPKATSVDALRSARGWGYAAAGREIEKIYFDTKHSGKDATIAAMKAKIEAISKDGKRVSLHCVSKDDYNKNNIVDIPYSSVIANKRKDFELALMGMTQRIDNIRYPKPVAGETYITKLIIEDKCWHLEVAQTNKPLPNQNRNIALAKAAASAKSMTFRGQAPTNMCGLYMSFLDWN